MTTEEYLHPYKYQQHLAIRQAKLMALIAYFASLTADSSETNVSINSPPLDIKCLYCMQSKSFIWNNSRPTKSSTASVHLFQSYSSCTYNENSQLSSSLTYHLLWVLHSYTILKDLHPCIFMIPLQHIYFSSPHFFFTLSILIKNILHELSICIALIN